MPFRSRLRALLTASRASGNTMRRRFGSPRAAKGGDTSGRPMEAWSLERTLSIRHSARVPVAPDTCVSPSNTPGETSFIGPSMSTLIEPASAAGVLPAGFWGLEEAAGARRSAASSSAPTGSDAALANANPGGSSSPGGKPTGSVAPAASPRSSRGDGALSAEAMGGSVPTGTRFGIGNAENAEGAEAAGPASAATGTLGVGGPDTSLSPSPSSSAAPAKRPSGSKPAGIAASVAYPQPDIMARSLASASAWYFRYFHCSRS
mmetsp:Transcript_14455/g.37045  ORF Transcript_14455/g.37045 Transcript_14455/m.37045 type:complete len:262 (+) Transcript_14455:522-1307(+)